MNKNIEYGTKALYYSPYYKTPIECIITGYNKKDDTYNIAKGWDLCHVNKKHIEIIPQLKSKLNK